MKKEKKGGLLEKKKVTSVAEGFFVILLFLGRRCQNQYVNEGKDLDERAVSDQAA